MSLFTSIPGKCFSLSEAISSDAQIPAFVNGQSHVINALLPDKFTYMQITDGANCEFVRVELNSTGTGLVLSGRGLDGTDASSFAKGAKFFFTWTETALDAYLTCRASTVDEDDAPIKIPGFTPVFDEETQQWCYEPDEDTKSGEVSWIVGKTKYTFADGCVTTEAVSTPGIAPGTYNNATITIDDDCQIKAVSEGDKPLYTPSVCDKCCPSTTDDTEDTDETP